MVNKISIIAATLLVISTSANAYNNAYGGQRFEGNRFSNGASEQVLHVLCSHAGYMITMYFGSSPDDALRNFVSPNAIKTVNFHQYKTKFDEDWTYTLHITEDKRTQAFIRASSQFSR